MTPNPWVLGTVALLAVAGVVLWAIDRVLEGKARHDF